MASKADRYPDNCAGAFYVDDQCIDCDACRVTAPEHFRRSDEQGYSFVFHQPESEEERRRCQDAMDGCPVEAIGNDGN